MRPETIRAAVRSYFATKQICEGPDEYGHLPSFNYLSQIEDDCLCASASPPSLRWARTIVGPVLAAGLSAATSMREDVPNAGAALRVFGLTGERSLTNQQAWKLVQPYAWEPVLSTTVLEDLQRLTSLRLSRLPAEPGPVDVLLELTRPRTSEFSVQMAHWISQYWKDHALEDNPYVALYCGAMADLTTANERGEMAQFTGAPLMHGKMSREAWQELIHGRLPQARLELRASTMATRQFILDYWQRCQDKKPKEMAEVK